jgi:hypothetical protein
MLVTGDNDLREDGERQSSEYTVRLWETVTGKVRKQWKGHQAKILSVAFSSDGKRLVSSSFDTTVLIWDVQGNRAKQQQAAARDLDAWWKALAGEDAAAAYEAIGSLAAAPEHSIPFLKAGLRPAPTVEVGRLEQLIAGLDAEDFATRRAAATELEKLSQSAGPALRNALESGPSVEARRRIEQLLAKLDNIGSSPETLRSIRAVEVLEHIAAPEARELLRKLAEGAPEAHLTREAKAALDRLARRPASVP